MIPQHLTALKQMGQQRKLSAEAQKGLLVSQKSGSATHWKVIATCVTYMILRPTVKQLVKNDLMLHLVVRLDLLSRSTLLTNQSLQKDKQ